MQGKVIREGKTRRRNNQNKARQGSGKARQSKAKHSKAKQRQRQRQRKTRQGKARQGNNDIFPLKYHLKRAKNLESIIPGNIMAIKHSSCSSFSCWYSSIMALRFLFLPLLLVMVDILRKNKLC
jgi:hypothetical protein